MYLKRLDLQGFKSFPEKVKLEFNPGITAVVGPNGSGKSNVSDAVRWVLGEQRAKSLRGDKMEDVIFAGTESRKPQGFAEVTIVIDNQDGRMPVEFTEVQVTRRVFRSGESEYRINGAACRLKDIQELFMDTGVGREGYSIVGQGRIDEILNAKGEERRRIFEEATGIVKYKTRKIEATNKLEKEQQNLLRVEDIISELEGQLAPLEEQSETARQFLSLREQLKQAEIAMFCTEAEQMEQEFDRLTEQMALAAEQQAAAQKEGNTAKAQIAEKKRQNEEKNAALQTLNDTIAQVKADIEKTEGRIRLAEEQSQNDAANLTRMEKEVAAKEKQQAEKLQETEVCRSRITALKMTMDREQEQLDTLEASYENLSSTLQLHESRAESFKDEIFEQIRIGTEAKGEIAKREAMMEQFSSRKEQLETEIAHTQSRLEHQEVHQKVLEKKAQEQQETAEFLEQELDALEQDSRHASETKAKAERALAQQERLVSEKKSRLRLLSELEREHEGFYNSVKSLLNLPDQKERGICGAVGQLLQVEEAYETAIEAALGGAMQNVVTKTEEDAKNAIQYLKQRHLGRATFLPITAVKGRGLEGRPAILEERGVIGTADTLVTFAEEYRGIMTYLLGRILIVENLDEAVRLAKKYRHQYKMVTLEGDIMNPGGAMTGGSQAKKTTNIFGRTREIHTLQKELEDAGKQTASLEEALQLAEEDLQEIAEQIMEKKLELQKLTVTIQTGKGEMAKMESEIAETNSRLKLLELEERQLADQLSRAEGDIAKSKETLAQSEAAMAQANESLSAFQENLAEEKEQQDHLMEEITQVKIRISNSGQQIYAAEETVLRLQQEAENLQKETRQLHQQMELLRESGDKRGETQEALHAEREKLEQQEETLRQQLEETNALIASLTADTAELEEAVQTAADTATKLENELFRIETKQEKINEEKQRIFDRMWEEYEITIGAAKEASKEEKRPYGELKRLSKEWKNDMRALGNVNVGAIDQYREVKERFDFLTNQRADILEAEEKLRQIIAELTELMEKQFREQFAVISKNFSEVFQEMFGGGKAYLKLSDDANALESSIDIVAQPPGKSLQNMQLLSGGERALTAIAILFSILKMKPSPFCILDEIEAALDDANVRRYAQYLTRFSKETQFIVITHRKGTMEYADVMYGVTMQEKGVSKLISVDFSKAQEDVV